MRIFFSCSSLGLGGRKRVFSWEKFLKGVREFFRWFERIEEIFATSKRSIALVPLCTFALKICAEELLPSKTKGKGTIPPCRVIFAEFQTQTPAPYSSKKSFTETIYSSKLQNKFQNFPYIKGESIGPYTISAHPRMHAIISFLSANSNKPDKRIIWLK